MTDAQVIRTPANRVKLWNDTVHYAAPNGRPACGSGARTHSTWMHPTVATVTCQRCVAAFGADAAGRVDPPIVRDGIAQRAAARAERQARRGAA